MVFKVQLIGFTPVEEAAFDSFFRFTRKDSAQFARTGTDSNAEVVIANANSPLALAQAQRSAPSRVVVLVGEHDPGLGLPFVSRPIRPINHASVMRTVEQQISQRQPKVVELSTGTVAGSASRPGENGNRILLVDDSEIALRFMVNMLGAYDMPVDVARSGEEALSCVARQPYRIVFLDVMLPGVLDGYQVCRATKQHRYPDGQSPLVIMLTSRGGSFDRIRGALGGCDAYLTKPLVPAELAKVMVKHGFRPASPGAKAEIQAPVPARI